jgi:mannose-1-phosphate guanylyltransferase/mannose-6-phosphate isomerase
LSKGFNMIKPVILCGGSGTRLWPLSRKSFPKQFVPLLGDQSLFELTIERLKPMAVRPLGDTTELMCVAADEHRFLVAEALLAQGALAEVILEPAARNTAAAIALACLRAQPTDCLLFSPADHHIPDAEAFQAVVRAAHPHVEAGDILLFGIAPTHTATGYGYLKASAKGALPLLIERFIEKPERAAAEQMLKAGGHYWNAGIFFARADAMLAALRAHAPDILKGCEEAVAQGREETFDGIQFFRPGASFSQVRAESIDYAVMEKAQGLKLMPFEAGWSDVGSWSAVASLTPSDAQQNQFVGAVVSVDATGSFVHSPETPVALIGVEGLAVVVTPDAILVASKDRAEDVKKVVAQLDAAGDSVAVSHRKVARPWGWYDSVDRGDRFQVKRIAVKPGASISLQKHHHRAEHWIVVKGTAEVTCDGKTFLLSENQSTYIPIGSVHRLSNPGRTDLEIIEVQSGGYLGEDDIVRLEDVYGRGNDGGKGTPGAKGA